MQVLNASDMARMRKLPSSKPCDLVSEVEVGQRWSHAAIWWSGWAGSFCVQSGVLVAASCRALLRCMPCLACLTPVLCSWQPEPDDCTDAPEVLPLLLPVCPTTVAGKRSELKCVRRTTLSSPLLLHTSALRGTGHACNSGLRSTRAAQSAGNLPTGALCSGSVRVTYRHVRPTSRHG